MTDTFGPFRLLARLGRGGMAETFIAERVGPVGFAKRVCLKRILADHGTDAEFVRLFQHEARLAANLDHPNIVTTFDFGEVEGTWWMSLQLVDGVDLRELVVSLRARGETLPREVALYVVREVAQALDYAHTLTLDGSAAHVVHRDVSPSNVLVSCEGAVKLADFGIAKAATSDLRTQTGIMRGKPSYMAPEQALAKPVDGRADLFALGVVLFELLAGTRPFDVPRNDVATIQNVIGGRRKNLLALAPDVPDAIVALVDGLLDPDLELRTSSAREVTATFQRDIPLPPDVARTLGALVRSVRPPEPILAGGLTVRDAAASKPPVVTVTPETAPEGAREVETPATTPMTTSTSGRRTTRATLGVVAGVVIVASLAAVASLRTIVAPAATATQVHATSREAAREEPPEPVAPPPTVEAPAIEAADAPPPEPTATERATPARATTRTRATSPEAPSPPRDEAAPEPATLVVVVPPWGEVRINGRSAGQSPITEQLAPGRYVIEGRRDIERAEQVITLAPGERREIVLQPRAP
ncbi:MAG: protein kinase [Kofleriaceae bacterium]|nr:protein kinase [Kofleriaceae bacterium]